LDPTEYRILAIVLAVLVPGLGHIILKQVRKGIIILLLASLFALLPTSYGLLIDDFFNLLTGVYILSQSEQITEYMNAVLSFPLISSLLSLPSIVIWVLQLADAIRISRTFPIQPSRKEGIKIYYVLIGSAALGIGIVGVLSFASSMQIYTEVGLGFDIYNDTINAQQRYINDSLRATEIFTKNANYVLYVLMGFVSLSIVGLAIFVYGATRRSNAIRSNT
jgi:TM2 domain-containing membrane protein YozV